MKIIFSFVGLALLALRPAGAADDSSIPSAPEWARNLVIYEIATKAFTSPQGPESGTFRSLEAKVPYLADLGINAVWLTGWNLANDHFHAIWTQYATIDPARLDPSLGTEQDFKDLIAAFHERGIKVFLDSTEHGVVNESPLIAQHPAWFIPGTWRMTDYDWRGKNGPHPDLDQWWVGLWTHWLVDCGADGARLDVAMGQPADWAEIKRRCASAGHPIAIFVEAPLYDPVSDFIQRSLPLPIRHDGPMRMDPAKLFGGGGNLRKIQTLQLSCHDYPRYAAEGSPFYFGYYLFAPADFLFVGGEEFNATYRPLPRMRPDTYGEKPPGPKSFWLYGSWIQWDQLAQKPHADMLAAVKRLLRLRAQESDLVRACGDGVRANIADVDNYTAANLAHPYVIWNDRHALLIGGHTNAQKSLSFVWNVPVDRFGWKTSRFRLTDLWGHRAVQTLTADDLAKWSLTIGPDGTPDGGLALFDIMPAD